ncbi:MAG: glycosyltransferase, partial [Pseudomonadota bacterium]
ERTNDIIAIGGLRHLKGGDTLVRLAERLKASGDPATVISVGGPDDERLVAAAERVGNIRRVGFLSDTALAEALGRARALVFLSRYEGFGMPPLEAMALQTPVIASNATALPEVVGDGAIVVDPDDTDAAFAALTRLTEDAPWREDLVARGLAQARRHTWEAVADKVAAALLSAR